METLSLAEQLQALLAKIVYIFMLQSCMKQFFPTSEKDE
jgi:hypothetical protein